MTLPGNANSLLALLASVLVLVPIHRNHKSFLLAIIWGIRRGNKKKGKEKGGKEKPM